MQSKVTNDLLPVNWNFIFGLGILNKLDLKYLSMACKIFYKLINDINSDLIKNSPWPISDYNQRLSERDRVFFKMEVGIVSLVQLKNGDFICGLDNGKIHILDADIGTCKQSLDGHLDSNRTKASALAQLSLFGFDTSTHGPIKLPVRTIHEHSNGDIISGADDKTICIFDVKSGKCKRKLTGHAGYVIGIKELANGNIISGSHYGNLHVGVLETGENKKILGKHDCGITSLVVLKNDSVVTGGLDGSLCVWNIALEKQTIVEGHAKAIRIITLFDDKTLITGSDDNTLCLWDTETWKCKLVLRGHTDTILSAAVLDEEYIVSGSNDMTVRVWNTTTGECKSILKGHTDNITAIVRKHNGDIASVSDDNTFRIWHFGCLDARQDAEQAIVPANKMRL